MFIPVIEGQGTEELKNIKRNGLEITATFDPQTNEFVVHSPTLTSSKLMQSILVLKSMKRTKAMWFIIEVQSAKAVAFRTRCARRLYDFIYISHRFFFAINKPPTQNIG
ncbi:hypothetical protein HanXRQr2_Chr10g0451601 [Helianthus annuus]|uniref:Uncharacterized protein n=2 Tax=Helianthus annuus TaxID=4232 RepID=A0A9K3HZJ4_HELAN|nr:hypothetical protein HanXRQr2_Chr10g0451601 [Helianthus annuus]